MASSKVFSTRADTFNAKGYTHQVATDPNGYCDDGEIKIVRQGFLVCVYFRYHTKVDAVLPSADESLFTIPELPAPYSRVPQTRIIANDGTHWQVISIPTGGGRVGNAYSTSSTRADKWFVGDITYITNEYMV